VWDEGCYQDFEEGGTVGRRLLGHSDVFQSRNHLLHPRVLGMLSKETSLPVLTLVLARVQRGQEVLQVISWNPAATTRFEIEKLKKEKEEDALEETGFVNIWVEITEFCLDAEGRELDDQVVRHGVHPPNDHFIDLNK